MTDEYCVTMNLHTARRDEEKALSISGHSAFRRYP